MVRSRRLKHVPTGETMLEDADEEKTPEIDRFMFAVGGRLESQSEFQRDIPSPGG
jgi:hypothetical protein